MVSNKAAEHLQAAGHHERAADNHERAAKFWEGKGDSERACLQYEMAKYERRGAELERRWAELTDSPAEHGGADAAEHVKAHTRQGAETASSILMQLADTLERTAALAESTASGTSGWEEPIMPSRSARPLGRLVRRPSALAPKLSSG